MKNGILKLNWENVKSALVYGLMWGILAIIIQIKEIGSIFNLDWYMLANVFVMALIGFVIPIIKNLFTTKSGNFLGVIKVIPSTKK